MPEGIYSIYFSAQAGSAFSMIVIMQGVIAGADAAGNTFDGSYDIDPKLSLIEGEIKFLLKKGSTSILGITATEKDVEIVVPMRLPVDLMSRDFFRVETELGPINLRFVKIRGL
tara:strand:+ start:57 stop:398 length:342 start_codon:yes stop_codon:yes gene_type:complete